MTQEMLLSPASTSSPPIVDLRFAVVITDGHVTGNPCGGIKVSAEKARDKNISIFAVAASSSYDDTGMKEIANTPDSLYWQQFQAVDLSQGKAVIQQRTIDSIIKAMVMHRHTDRDTRRNTLLTPFLTLCFSCLHRNITLLPR